LRLLSFSPASSATRVALQSRSRSLSLSERTEKAPFGGLFLLRNGHRAVRNPASPVFSPAPGPIRTARNGLSAVGRYSASTPAVSFAQFPAVRRRSCERVLSAPLPPFPVGLATRRERQQRTSAWPQLSCISTRCAAVAVTREKFKGLGSNLVLATQQVWLSEDWSRPKQAAGPCSVNHRSGHIRSVGAGRLALKAVVRTIGAAHSKRIFAPTARANLGAIRLGHCCLNAATKNCVMSRRACSRASGSGRT
jgi:hypothetical protein